MITVIFLAIVGFWFNLPLSYFVLGAICMLIDSN